MNMKEYFACTTGRGVLATADGDGQVDAAIYSSPHVQEDSCVAFIMRDRLTHHNLLENPHAAYLFSEEGADTRGVRLFLKKITEETESEKIMGLMRRQLTVEEYQARGPLFLVTFAVEKILPLIGDNPAGIPFR